jgi:hypothetical protein
MCDAEGLSRVQPGLVPTQRAIVLLAAGLAVGLLAQYLLVGERLGLGVAVGIGGLLAAHALLGRPSAPSIPTRVATSAVAMTFAALVAVRADPALVALDVAAALAVAATAILLAPGRDLTRLGVAALPRLCLDLTGGLATRAAAVCRAALPAVYSSSRLRSSAVLPYAAGVALAAPFLVVFALLFSSADAVFQRSLRDAFDLGWVRDLVRELPARLFVTLVASWLAIGALGTAADQLAPGHAEPRVRRLLAAQPVVVALLAIDLLFAAFVALQLAYLFGGRDTVDASGLTYSAYARRGFFELVAVATLVGTTLFAFDVVVRVRSRPYIGAALALIGLTGIVLLSAAARLTLYQQAYGWTELRLYTYAVMAFLGLALLVSAWALIADRMEFLAAPLAAAALAVALALNLIGPSGAVAAANIDRFLDPAPLPEDAYRELDIGYLARLGDGAIPAIVERLPSLPERERTTLRGVLAIVSGKRPGPGGWQSWNWDRARATELLRTDR